jgi:hypothetical protein
VAEPKKKPTCFMAMPITTHPDDADRYGGDKDHWSHVMASLFVKAIESAGFDAIRPVAQGSHLIHGLIIRHLSTADLVLVDLSSHNPNVFFELGVRTSLNLPIALVRDEHTSIPFDTSGINTYSYDSNLRGWEIEEQQTSLAQHIMDSHASCAGQNPLWRQFGLTIKAQEPDTNESPLEAKVDLLTDRLAVIQQQIFEERHQRATEREAIEESRRASVSAARRHRELRGWDASDLNLAEQRRMEASRAEAGEHFPPGTERMSRFLGDTDELVARLGLPVQMTALDEFRAKAVVLDASRWAPEFHERLLHSAQTYGIHLSIELSDSEASMRTPRSQSRGKRDK